jgi:hypothetical protein
LCGFVAGFCWGGVTGDRFFVYFKLFTLEFSFTFACLPIGKQALTLLSQAIYSASSIIVYVEVLANMYELICKPVSESLTEIYGNSMCAEKIALKKQNKSENLKRLFYANFIAPIRNAPHDMVLRINSYYFSDFF